MKNILIIEDDRHIAAALEARFRANGYATSTVCDAVLGLSQAVQRRPDLILLDISLPGGDGLVLAEKLRSLPDTKQTPIILITASRDTSIRARAMKLNVAGLFDKPYDAEELLAVAGHALGDTGVIKCQRPASPPITDFLDNPLFVKKILVVEDDYRIATALALRLNAAGFEVSTAYDALSGLSAAVKIRPDLILLDISMPAGNGFTVAERIQNLIPGPTPIIFLTASKQPGFRERAEELGASGFFEKPYDAEQLLAVVRQTVGAGSV